jgi:uncharacterized membrane protein
MPNTAPEPKPYKIDQNVEAALSYLFTPFSGIFVLFMEKHNRFVRFHAAQSVAFGITAFAAWSIANTLKILLIGLILEPIVSITVFVLWVYLMWKAYLHVEAELPILGKIARDYLDNKLFKDHK